MPNRAVRGRGTLRVIAGEFRGRRLVAPPGDATRPTADRVREALFDILATRVIGSRFLDAYAGSGAVGIEALSRGAASVTFVESRAESIDLVRKNLERIQAPDRQVLLLPYDLAKALRVMAEAADSGNGFDIVYLDPPYAGGELDRGLRLLARDCALREGGLIIAEHESRGSAPVPEGFAAVRTTAYGRAALTFFEPLPGRPAPARATGP